jgi:LCP family protein required for cell wall assembly
MRRSRWRSRRTLVEAAVLLVIVVAVALGSVAWVNAEISRNVERLGDPFAELPVRPDAPPVAAGERAPVNILVLGSDRNSDSDQRSWEGGDPHADSVMLLHLPADRERLYVMSFPRDSWVTVPEQGSFRISTVYSLGGPGLIVHTVEQLTGIRIDHLAVANFGSFARLTDHLGGVTVSIPDTTYDSSHGVLVPAGTYRMDGAEALRYVRQRYGLPDGDLDRVQRQQNWLRSIAQEAMDRGVADNPLELTRVLTVLSESIAVDDGLTVDRMRELALSARPVDEADDMVFFTAPVASVRTRADGITVATLDRERLGAVSEAIANDGAAEFLADHPGYLETLDDRVD